MENSSSRWSTNTCVAMAAAAAAAAAARACGGADQGGDRLVAVLGAKWAGEAPPRDLEGAHHQDGTGDQLGEFGQLGNHVDVRHDQRLDEGRQRAIVRAGAALHEVSELLSVV